MIDVGSIVVDPDFAQPYTVHRKSGAWVAGRWEPTEDDLPYFGAIMVATQRDLNMIPEGDRVSGMMMFFAVKPLNLTSETGTSDEITWKNERYRLTAMLPWSDFGFYQAFGVRKVTV